MNELEEEGFIDDEPVGDTSGDIDLNFVLESDEESPIVTSSSSFDHDHHILGSEARLSGRRQQQQQQQFQQGQPQHGPRHTLLPSQVPLGPSVSPQTFFRNAVIQFNRDGSGSSETNGRPDQYGTSSLPISSRFVPSFTTSRLDGGLTESDPGDHAFYDSGSSDAFFLPSGLIGSDLDLDSQMQMQMQMQLQQLQLQKQHQYQLQLQQLRYREQQGQGSLPPTNHFTRQSGFASSSSYPPSYDQDTFESELDQSADDLCWDDLTTFVDHLDSPHRSHSNPSELRRPNTPPRFINISNPTPVQQRSNERPAGRVGMSPPQTIGVSMNFAPELTRHANSPPSPTGGLPFPSNNPQPAAFNPSTSYQNRKMNQYVSSGPGLLSNPPPARGGGPGRFQGRGGMRYPPRGGFGPQNNHQQPIEMGRYRHNPGRGTGLTPLPASKGQQHGPKGASPPSSVNRPKSLPAPLSPPPPPHSTQVQLQTIQPQPPKRKETHEADKKKIATPQSSSAPQLPQLPPALMPKTPTPASPPQVPDKRTTPVKSAIASIAPVSPSTDSSRRSPSAASSKPTKRDSSEGTKDVKENKEPPTQAETKTTKRNNKSSNAAGSTPTKISPRSSGVNSLPSSPATNAEIDAARATTSTDTTQPTSSLTSSTEQASQGAKQKDSKSKQSQRLTSVTPSTTVVTTTSEEPAARPGKTKKGKTTSSATATTTPNVPPRNASLEKSNQTFALTTPSPSPYGLTSAVVALGQKKLIGPVVLFFAARILALLAVLSLINAAVRRVVKSVLNFHKTAFKALTRSYYVTFTFFYVYFFPWFAYSLKSLTHQAPTISWYIFLAWFLMTKRCCNMPNLRLLPLLFVFDGLCDPRFITVWNGGERLVFALVLLTVKSHQDMLSRNCYLSVTLLLGSSIVVGAYYLVQWFIFMASLYTFNVCLTKCPLKLPPSSSVLVVNTNNNNSPRLNGLPQGGPAPNLPNLLPTTGSFGA